MTDRYDQMDKRKNKQTNKEHGMIKTSPVEQTKYQETE